MASLSLVFPLLDYWRQLRDGTRDAIIGGLVVAIVLGVATVFHKALLSGLRQLIGADSQSSPPPAPPQVIVNIPAATLPRQSDQVVVSQPTISAPLIPKPPAVGFVARRDKDGHDIVELLKRGLSPESNLLVVLWGEGGIGKTTLAAEVARALIKDYGQRLVWTSADKRADFTYSTFLDEIALRLNRNDLLRLAVDPKTSEVQMLVAEATTLIILDNFETISPDEAKSCSEFLANKATCSGLITTREQVTGARNIRIDAMSRAEGKEFLERLINQSAEPSAFDGLDRERLMETAALNPLVMEWVVAQIGLAQRPVDVLEDLSYGKGDAAQRVFDRSFDLPQLGDDGRTVLLALSLFVPSASRGALAKVAGFGDDKNRLNEAVKRLAALRLLSTADGGQRLQVQGLTRELARARLEKY